MLGTLPDDLLPLIVRSTRVHAALSRCSRGLNAALAGAVKWLVDDIEVPRSSICVSRDVNYSVHVYDHVLHYASKGRLFLAKNMDIVAAIIASYKGATVTVGDGVLFGDLDTLHYVIGEIFGNRASVMLTFLGDIHVLNTQTSITGSIVHQIPTNRLVLMREFKNFPVRFTISDVGNYDNGESDYKITFGRDKIIACAGDKIHMLMPLTSPKTHKYVYIIEGVPMQSDSTAAELAILVCYVTVCA